MAQSLDGALSGFSDKVSDLVRGKKSVLVATHIDCDGLTSGSIITKALIRAGASVTVRAYKEFSPGVIDSLRQDGRDFHIVTDLGGGFAEQLDEKLGEDWYVLDHHEISDGDADNPRVINAWKYGIDGGAEICAGGMAYLASVSLDERNADLSAVAVVSALGDRQDQGPKKAFVGKNAEIANTAKGMGILNIGMDLLLVGRETRPLADALAFTSQPFIEGITWNRDACYALLQNAGIPMKDGGRWRVPSEMTDEERQALIAAIAQFASGKNATEMMGELIGCTYTFPREDGMSFLKDGREFSTMLNSCGRINKSGVGIAVCMGDRDKILREGQGILAEYRGMIRDYMNILGNERWRVSESESCVMVNGDGVVPETMSGTISSLIAGSPKNAGKIVILRTGSEEGKVKFSSRKSPGCKSDVNLSQLMRSGAEKFEGVGGGHDAAAGAKITKDKLDGFLDYLQANVVKVSGSGNSE